MAKTVRKSDRAPGAVPVSKKKYKNSVALYGRSGTGKTTLAGTFPKPILYLNIRDNGTDSISDVEDIDVVDIDDSETLKETLLWCHKQAQRGKLKYKTIVLDTMSQLQSILVEELGEKKKLSGKKRAGDFGTFTMQEWGTIAGDLKAVIMDARNLPLESVFICQERVFNIGDEGDDGLDQLDPEVGPKLMPSVKNDLNASVSIIANTFIKVRITKTKNDKGKKVTNIDKIYCLRLGPNEVYTTKIRKPKGIEAPDFIVDPTFRKLKKIMKGIEADAS
jgi:phage nucleotide-binding protein